MVAINSDIPDTTVVGAYVSKSNNHGDLSQFDDMAGGALPSGGYMVTIANKSVKEVPGYLSYYSLPDVAVEKWICSMGRCSELMLEFL